MKDKLRLAGLALATAAIFALQACGGGSDAPATPDAPAVPTAPAAPPVASTTPVPVTVVDGAVGNATVCLDKNKNGLCDPGEPSGKTNASGNVTLQVDPVDAGKYPILAVIGTDATDADTGPVKFPYTMTAPADKAAVVSPLTTLVQTLIAGTGASSSDAETSVRQQTGLNVSLFEDFTKNSTSDSKTAGTVARMVVVFTQQQNESLKSQKDKPALDGTTITQRDLDKAIQKKLLELLPKLLEALSDPAVLSASGQAREDLLLASATTIIASSGLNTVTFATIAAINNQNASTTPVVAVTPTAGFTLDSLNFTDISNWFVRSLISNLAQATPDASNNTRYLESHSRATNGVLATWGLGTNPARNADLNWNGSAWVNCPINYENTGSVRDAQGNSSYSYCNGRETGKSNRATFDISGKSMLSVYNDATAAGFNNLVINGTASAVLGTATYPADSKIYYQTVTPLTEAIGYYPGGGSYAVNYSAGLAAGGGAPGSPTAACISAESQNLATITTATLESLIAFNLGTPCIYGTNTFTVGSNTFSTSGRNEWWGQSTVNIGTLGTVNPSSTPTAYYTGNTLILMSFAGTGTNPVTYYSCAQRYQSGSQRNCTVIGTGNYTIASLGDARVMTLSGAPPQAAALTYSRVFVERGGKVWYGYQNKPNVGSRARLNTTAANALFANLGLPSVNVGVPLALTVASYAGEWRATDATGNQGGYITAKIGNDASPLCSVTNSNGITASRPCMLTMPDPSTGVVTIVFGTGTDPAPGNDGTFTGKFNFLTGAITEAIYTPRLTIAPASTLTGARR
jgi:hypothetical protein